MSNCDVSFRFCSSPTPTDNTPIPSSDRGIDTQLDSNASDRVITPIRHFFMNQYCHLSNVVPRSTTNLCIRTDSNFDLVKAMYRYLDTNEYEQTTMIWYTIRHQDSLNRLIKK